MKIREKEVLSTGEIKRYYADMKRKVDKIKKSALYLAISFYPPELNPLISKFSEIEKSIQENLDDFETLVDETKEKLKKMFHLDEESVEP